MDGKVNPQTGEVKVKPTLQIDGLPDNHFAVGDVAETGGAKQARAGMMQAEIAATNIVRLITGHPGALEHYVPVYFENALKLTIGKVSFISFTQTK
jgi:apoptosis-inducing factor 2